MKTKSESSLFLVLFWLILFLAILLSLGKYQSNKEIDTKTQNNNSKLDKVNTPPATATTSSIRKPFFAGSFYPEKKDDLLIKISSFIDQTPKKEIEGKIRFLIVPHAGLDHSGTVAAAGYKQVDFSTYSRVVIMSSSHSSSNKAISVYAEGAWETPLGTTKIDSEFAKRLLDENANIIFDSKMHENDHTLEMQLLFIQQASKNAKIVPISIGNVDNTTLEILANKLAFLMDENTLFIISADLSHYPTYELANKVDKETIEAILTGDSNKFSENLNERISEKKNNLETYTCGEKAIRVMLDISNLKGINDIELIKYANSGDTGGDKKKVVGYSAISGQSTNLQDISFTKEDEEEALNMAMSILTQYLETKKVELQLTNNPKLHVPMGVFSTINNKDTLRGCIGAFSPTDPLYYSIQRLTLEAAINDKRFIPVKKSEIADLNIELSFMSEKTKVGSIDDVILGEHGVQISKGGKSGTFLPEVAESFDMDKTKFFEELCTQKANLPKDCYKDSKVNIYTFTTKKVK